MSAKQPLDDLRVDDVRSYLERLGWGRVKVGDEYEIWRAPNDGPTAIVPTVPLVDYGLRMHDVVDRVATVQAIPVAEVLTRLRWGDHDRLSVATLLGEESASLGIDDALSMGEAVRDMLIAAARASVNPQPSYQGGWPAVVSRYLSFVRILPVRQSSFAYDALLPTTDPRGDQLRFPSIPDEEFRKTSDTLFTAANSAVEVAVEHGADEGRFGELVERGVSADLLDALVRLSPEGTNSDVRLTVDWSPRFDHRAPVRTNVGGRVLPILSWAADFLRGGPQDVRLGITGLVVTLHRQQGSGPGEITIRGFLEGTGWGTSARSLKIELDQPAYERAMEAHRAGTTVRAICDVRHENGRLVVRSLVSFETEE